MENFHKELNSKLWNGKELKGEVSDKLKEIAEAFIKFLEIPVEAVKDIVITGSCASYNYTPYSDIDLHLIIDFEKVHKDCPIVQGYLLSKKSEFNKNHDIHIYGIPVEVYAESVNNENVHNGLYSLMQDKWLEEPQKITPPKNSRAVRAKFNEFKEAVKNVADGEVAKQLMEKIKDMRKAGLSTAGEFSVENLVFKKLRNEGIIGKLMDIKKEKVDKDLSLQEKYESIIGVIEEMLGTSAAAMAPFPTPVVGQEQPTQISKQNSHKQKPAMYNYRYQKVGRHKSIVESMEEIVDFCGKIFEYDEEHGNPQPHNKALNKLKDDIAVLKSRRRHAKKVYPKVEQEKKDLRNYATRNPIPYLLKVGELDKLAADRWDNDKEIDDKVTRRNKLQNLKGLTSPKYI